MTNQEFIDQITKKPYFFDYYSEKIEPIFQNVLPLKKLIDIYDLHQSLNNGGTSYESFKQFLQFEALRILRLYEFDSELAYCLFSLVKNKEGEDCIRFEGYRLI